MGYYCQHHATDKIVDIMYSQDLSLIHALGTHPMLQHLLQLLSIIPDYA